MNLSALRSKASIARSLENRIFFGTVSSNRGHFERTLVAMADIEVKFPGLIARVITERLPFEDYPRVLTKGGIKKVLTVHED